MSPGSIASFGTMWPAPKSNGSAGVVPSSLTTLCRPVVISADLIAAGVQSGCASRSSAATPATCGTDIDVPLRYWKFSPRTPFATSGVCPARISTPGAVTSGFRISGAVRFGPRDEKPPITSPSSGCVRNSVLSSVTSTMLSSCSSWSSS